MQWEKGSYCVTDDKNRLDFDFYKKSMKTTYWAQDRTVETMEKSMEKSTVLSMFHKNRQIGFVRLVSDFVTFSWICDVYIHPDFRRGGLSKWLMECTLEHPSGKTRINILATSNAAKLYEKFGFNTSEKLMIKRNNNII